MESLNRAEELFGKLPKRAGWQPALPGTSLHLDRDRQQMIDHVGATIRIAMHWLGST